MIHTRPTLSAIIITRNEAHNLDDCLQSMHGLVDEILVVDSQSTDATVAIAQQHGAKVAQPADWPGFGPQKNRALDLATCDWVFSIDADERVTPELAMEIKRVMPMRPTNCLACRLTAVSSFTMQAGSQITYCDCSNEAPPSFQTTSCMSAWSPNSKCLFCKTICCITATSTSRKCCLRSMPTPAPPPNKPMRVASARRWQVHWVMVRGPLFAPM
jgi:hypothetical protein